MNWKIYSHHHPVGASWIRMLPLVVIAFASTVNDRAMADPDFNVTKAVWKSLYGVTDAQINDPIWLAQDADGDGVSNGAEIAAGTNPFKAGSVLKVTTVTKSGGNVNVSFPSQSGKLYVLQSSPNLLSNSWTALTPNVQVVGDGTTLTLTAPVSVATAFYRVLAQDIDSTGDQVGDWAKKILGYSTGSSISTQSSFTDSSLLTALQSQNVVSLTAVDNSTTQPAGAGIAASDLGTITISRSGFMLLNPITVPLVKSGSAVEGTDYATLPNSITFPAGVNSIDIKITPLYNPGRTTSGVATISILGPGTTGSAGNYSLGTPASASVTIYPPSSSSGTGLVGTYFNGSSTTYASNSNLGMVTATYTYAQSLSNLGTAVVTYTGTPSTPFAVGGEVYLTFTTGPLLTNDLILYAASGTPPTANRWDQSYLITAVNTSAKTLTVSVTGSPVPATGTGGGACFLGPFNAPLITRLDPTVDFVWGTGLPTLTALPTAANNNWAGRYDGYLSVPTTGTYNFQIQADDGARVYIDLDQSGTFDAGETIIDAWAPGSSTVTAKTGSAALTAGIRYHIRADYLQLNNTASVSLQWQKPGDSGFSNIPSANVFIDATTSTNAWTGQYWTNTSFAGQPRFGDYPTAINLNWGTGQPSQTLPAADNFSVRWEGYISSALGGTYNFKAMADDGAVVYIDLNQNGTFDGGAETAITTSGGTGTSANVTLATGQRYKMRVDFSETSGNAFINLGWMLNGGSAFTLFNASAVQTGTNLTVYRSANTSDATTGWWASYYSNSTLTAPPLYSAQDTSSTSLSGGSSNVTITVASPAVVTWTAHGLSANTPVVFATTGSLPTGLTAGTTYYVLSAGLTANTFEVSTSAGGSAVVTSGTQSGTQSVSTVGYTFGAGKPATSTLGTTTSDNWGDHFDSYVVASGGAGTYKFETSVLAGGGDFAHLLVDTGSGLTEVIPYNTGSLSNVTISVASPAVVTWSSHGLTAGTPVTFTTTGALPTGLTAGTTYYVSATGLSTSSFQASATPGGASINTSGSQSGTQTASTSTAYSITLTANQVLHVALEHYNISGNAFPGLWWRKPSDTTYTLIPAANLYRDSGTTTPGVVTSYWTNTALMGAPSLVQYLTQISLASTSTIPSSSITTDNFSASWEGYLQPSVSGAYTFDLQAEDGARLYLDLDQSGTFGAGETIIDAWAAGTATAAPIVSGSYNLTAGQRYRLRVEFYNTVGEALCKLRWSTPTSSGVMAGIPNTNLFRDATTSQIGVLATYYPNTTLTLPGAAPFAYSIAENNNPEVTYDFGAGRPGFASTVTVSIGSPAVVSAPAHGLQPGAVVYLTTTGALPTGLTAGTPYYVIAAGLTPDSYELSTSSGGSAVNTSGTQSGVHTATATLPSIDNFSIRWTGQVLPQYSETYYFDVRSDDGAKLWVNNQLVVNKWQSQGVTDQIGAINLQAGVLYDIRLEYLESTSTAEVHLNWWCNDQAQQIIPLTQLFPTMTGLVARSGDTSAGLPAITNVTNAVTLLGAGSPFSLTLSASNGAGTFTATGLPSWLTLSNGILSGTPTQAGTYQFTVTATNAAGSGSAAITIQVLSTGSQLTRDLWTSGVAGPNISDVPWTTTPGSTDTVSNAEDNTTTYGTNTGERLRGYITVPTTGNYYFWISSSNAAELWISNSAEPVSKVKRCYVTGPTGTAQRTWNSQIDTTAHGAWPSGSGANLQQSGWLALTAGQNYYIEVLHNTGSSGANNNLSVGWFLDPTGTTGTASSPPIANGSAPAAPTPGGVVPGYVLSPWNNPPTTTVPGSIYIADLQGASGLSGVTGTGGAYVRVSGSTGIVHLNYSGLTSGAIYRRIYAAPVGNNPPQLIFDLDAQDKNYPGLRTSDGGYTWNMQTSDLATLSSGNAFLSIATLSNPNGELTGTFTLTSGSQATPSVPSVPSWTDDSATDAGASRFLTQASFGPSPTDMAYVKANGYRAWIENQFTQGPTYIVPYLLNHLSSDPNFPYTDTLLFNAWWKNSVTAPDQLRQRIAFALSEILVVSDTGPLNLNGRTLGDYYDNLAQYGFDNYRNILKQVTLTSAMGIYLDMLENYLGNIQTGTHPNENYAREIMQLFSIGLYRLWPDGTLVLDSNGDPVPTYDQTVITGMARALTGWSYGQSLVSGRLPTNLYPTTNYLDPMVLVPKYHEFGTKILLDNVWLPAATITSSTDTTTSSYPITIQSTDPNLGPGNLVSTNVSNNYDLNGLKDLEAVMDSIHNNSSIAPYICRQLIQRLVTSSPSPAYVYRVVRAFTGERNVDGVATGVRGDMKDVIRAILLDPEARNSTAAAANVQFGKQREPVMRLTGPARAFPTSTLSNCTYRQNGLSTMVVTTPTPHRLVSDTVLIDSFADSGSSTTNLPSSQAYSVSNVTPSYTLTRATGLACSNVGNTVTITASGAVVGTKLYVKFNTGGLSGGTYDGVYTIAAATASNYTITLASSPANGSGTVSTSNIVITAPGYVVGDSLAIQFTSGNLNTATNGFNTVKNYTVVAATLTNFTIAPDATTITAGTGSTLMPNNFTITASSLTQVNGYTVSGTVLTVPTGGFIADGQHKVYLSFASGGLQGAGYDGAYTVATTPDSGHFTVNLASTPSNTTSGNVIIPKMSAGYAVTNVGTTSTMTISTSGNDNLVPGSQVQLTFASVFPNGLPAVPPVDGIYTVTSVTPTSGSIGNNTNQYQFTITWPTTISTTTQSSGLTVYPLAAPPYNRSGTCTIEMSSWNMGSSTGVTQTPLNSPTVFNFFYPSYSFPGAIAQAGMTTPEFQLTNDSNIISLTNTLNTGFLSTTNPNGLTSFPSNGGQIYMDLSPYMTSAQTADSAIPALITTLGNLLASGNLQAATQTKIANYITTNLNLGVSSISTGNPCTVTTSSAHGLSTGDSVTISGVTGGTFSPAINGTFTVTVTGANTFTVASNCTSVSGLNVTGAHVVFTPFPMSSPPTTSQMRDRVRGIVHMIIVSPEYAIQK